MNQRHYYRHFQVAAIVIVVLAQCGCQTASESSKPSPVVNAVIPVNATKAMVPKGTLSFEYSGVAVPKQSTEISFQLAGEVTNVFVDEGDAVKKGQNLAAIDKSRFRSSYNAASAMKRQADDAYSRLKQVYEKGSLPEIKWQEIVAKQQQADAATQLAMENLKDCVLKAPSDGVVAKRRIEKGANVTPNITVMEVVQLDEVYIRVSVPENEVAYFNTGQQGLVIVAAIGSKIFKASIDKIGVSASPLSKTYEVRLLVKNSDHAIKPGMAAVVKLDIEREQHLPTVPLRAVQQDRFGKKFVYIIDEKNLKAIRKDVELGRFYRNDVYITSGIQGGELVVTDGQHKLELGTDVTFRLLK
ncbi:MAG: efflux RND transporter periplasmic adaptor subunit [Deltaproteobacteria bacterium]|nr:efflux RND transporter periplasmic adaptor subunit [Deltaproteobacteria bacterium]